MRKIEELCDVIRQHGYKKQWLNAAYAVAQLQLEVLRHLNGVLKGVTSDG